MTHDIHTNMVHGSADTGFEPLRPALAEVLDGAPGGAALAVVRDGVLVADLWMGTRDAEGRDPWTASTVAPIFSGTKGLVAISAAVLRSRGLLGLDEPVRRYWPQLRAASSGELEVAHLLAHLGGLPAITTVELGHGEWLDPQQMALLLEREAPGWSPGSTLCYHPLTFGWLLDHLVRAVDGRSVASFFAEEVARPLGGLDAWIGVPQSRAADVAWLTMGGNWTDAAHMRAADAVAGSLTWGAYHNPPGVWLQDGLDRYWNTPAVHAAEIPGAGGVASARAMAQLYGALVDRSESRPGLLDPVAVDALRAPRSSGVNALTSDPFAFGAGVALSFDGRPFGARADAFGHGGMGGSVHGAWADAGVAFSFVCSHLVAGADDDRAGRLLDVLASCLPR